MAKEKSIRKRIIDLEIGTSDTFPLARYDYVVSCRQRIAATMGRTITSAIDKTNGTVTLTRTA